MKLDSDKRARLAKLIRLLGSDNAGEVAAAAHKLQEVLRSSGADLHDLAALLEDEQIAAMQGRSDQAGWTHDAPGPQPSSASPRSRRQRHRSFSGGGKLKILSVCIVAVVVVVGAVWMTRGPGDHEPRTAGTATAPSQSQAAPKLVAAAPPKVVAKQGPPPPPTIQAKQAPPPPTVAVIQDLPKFSPTVPRARPVVARPEPTKADTFEARNAARSAVGEIIRQIRFPQRVDRAITMVSIGAYGSEIIASYRAAVPANTMGGGALRRLAVETACGLPNMTSALNRGATHRARYTDPDGAVTEVVVAAQDCDY